MRRKVLGSVLAVATIAALLVGGAPPTTVAAASGTVASTSIGDAKVLERAPDASRPEGDLAASRTSGARQISYLKFRVPGDSSDQVQSVTLRLFPTVTDARGVKVWRTGNDWRQQSITWNDRPALETQVGASGPVPVKHTWIDIDLDIDLVPGKNISLALSDADRLFFRSSEHATKAPELLLTFGAPDPDPDPDVISIDVDYSQTERAEGMAVGTTRNRITMDGGDDAAEERAKALQQQVADYQVQPIMGFGAQNPWPREHGPKDWYTLDREIAEINESGEEPVITLYSAPDWMKYPDEAPLPDKADDNSFGGRPCFTHLNPTDDATVRSSSPGTQYPNGVLEASGGANDTVSYLQFELTGDDKGRVDALSLVLHPTQQMAGNVKVHEVSAAWSESDLRWNNRPAVGAQIGSVSYQNGSGPVTIDLDPASFVVGERNSIAVISSGSVEFHQKGSDDPPELHVDYKSGTVKPCVEVAPHPDHYRDFAQLSRAVARRYSPLGVRNYIVWSEVKGFWNRDIQNWDFVEFTKLYNAVYDEIKDFDSSLNVGGPYFVVAGTGSEGMPDPVAGTVPSQHARKMPIIDRDVEFFEYWVKNKRGTDFLALDRKVAQQQDPWRYTRDQEMSLTPLFGQVTTDLLALYDQFEREMGNTNPTLPPVWWVETYFRCDTDEQYMAAGLASMLLHQLNAGSAVSLRWSAERQPDKSPDMCDPNVVTDPNKLAGNKSGQLQNLWTSTEFAGGGQALPPFYVYRDFHEHFGVDNRIVDSTVSRNGQPVPELEAVASNTATMIVNKADATVEVFIGGETITLDRYEVRFVPR